MHLERIHDQFHQTDQLCERKSEKVPKLFHLFICSASF